MTTTQFYINTTMNTNTSTPIINNSFMNELSEPIIDIDTFSNYNISNKIHYTNICFKNINGIVKEYFILNYLNFETFISIIYNKIKSDYNFEDISSFEIIPSSEKKETGSELKEYLINNTMDISQLTSKKIVLHNKYYYVITKIEKEEIIQNQQAQLKECPICYENKKLYVYYNCSHSICNLCYIKWKIQLGETCPTCRSN